MVNGIVKSIYTESGLGYIQKSDGGEIVMIAKGMEDILQEGLPVNFDVKQTRVGVIAVNIQVNNNTRQQGNR